MLARIQRVPGLVRLLKSPGNNDGARMGGIL
jgi:hypothetical protein